LGEWQPIETAPKDGTEVLTCRNGNLMAVAFWRDFRRSWVVSDGAYIRNVTHWMPLPAPPKVSTPSETVDTNPEKPSENNG